MPTGLLIIDNANTILIDDTAPTMQLKEKGTATLNGSGFFIVQGKTGQMAVNGGSAVVGVHVTPAQVNYPAGHMIIGPPGTVVTWYLFDLPSGPVANFGLQVYSASTGQIMFDAGAKTLRTEGARQGSTRAAWQGAVGYTAGRSYAIMCSTNAMDSVNTFNRIDSGNYNQTENLSIGGAAINGSSINFAMTNNATRINGPLSGSVLPAGFTYSVAGANFGVVDISFY